MAVIKELGRIFSIKEYATRSLMCACHCPQLQNSETQNINRSRGIARTYAKSSPWHLTIIPNDDSLILYRGVFENFCRDIRAFEKLRNGKFTVTAAECDIRVCTSRITHRRRVMNPGRTAGDVRSRCEGAKNLIPATIFRNGIAAVERWRIYIKTYERKAEVCTSITEFDVLTAMQWPPPRPLSARRVSLPRCRRRGLRVTGVEREGRYCFCYWYYAAMPWQEPPRIIEGQSRFHRRNAFTFTEQGRERESLRFTALHAYARINVRRRALSRPDTARIKETRRRKVFFRARRGPPNRCVMLHFPTVFFDSADVLATSAIPQRVGVLDNLASGGIFEYESSSLPWRYIGYESNEIIIFI